MSKKIRNRPSLTSFYSEWHRSSGQKLQWLVETLSDEYFLEDVCEGPDFIQLKQQTKRLFDAYGIVIHNSMTTSGDIFTKYIESIEKNAASTEERTDLLRQVLTAKPTLLRVIAPPKQEKRGLLEHFNTFDRFWRTENWRGCCAMARDIRCEMVYLGINDSLHQRDYDKALRLFERSIEASSKITLHSEDLHFVRNIQSRLATLFDERSIVFAKQRKSWLFLSNPTKRTFKKSEDDPFLRSQQTTAAPIGGNIDPEQRKGTEVDAIAEAQEKMVSDRDWFYRNIDSFRNQYISGYLAVHQQRIIGHDSSENALLKKMYESYGPLRFYLGNLAQTENEGKVDRVIVRILNK